MDGEYGVVLGQLHQRLGVLLVRDNVAMLGSRIPSFALQEVDGDLDTGYASPHSLPFPTCSPAPPL